MKTSIVSSATLAVAAIALAIGGLSPAPASAKKAAVECMGINACKGKSACKTANNACKAETQRRRLLHRLLLSPLPDNEPGGPRNPPVFEMDQPTVPPLAVQAAFDLVIRNP